MTAESGRAEAVVRGFVDTYLSLRNEVLAWCAHQVAPAETLADFLQLVWSGAAPRSVIGEKVEYSVHGRIGCQLRSPDGTEVDIDLRDDIETFDLWRLHRYERSLGVTSELTDEALRSACQAFVERGELEVARAGWYALPGGKLGSPADA